MSTSNRLSGEALGKGEDEMLLNLMNNDNQNGINFEVFCIEQCLDFRC